MAYFPDTLLFSPYEVIGGKLKILTQSQSQDEEPNECHFLMKKQNIAVSKIDCIAIEYPAEPKQNYRLSSRHPVVFLVAIVYGDFFIKGTRKKYCN